jgi:hypothetical protein
LAVGLGAMAFLLTVCDTKWRRQSHDNSATVRLAKRLRLTDLALFNEARYARHLSQSDDHAALQDHPMALEHFPAGTVTAASLR